MTSRVSAGIRNERSESRSGPTIARRPGTHRLCAAALAALLLAACRGGSEAIRLAEDTRDPESPVLRVEMARGPVKRRCRAALAMGRIQSPVYAAPLAEAANDPDREVRLAALFALGQLGLARGAQPPEPAVAACRAALADPDVAVAARAVEALGKLAPAGAETEIVPLLEHPAADVRAEAALALFRLRFVPVWRQQAVDPPPLSPAAVDALIANLDDDDDRARWAAAYAFSRFGQPQAVAALTGLLDDPVEWARLFSVRALARSGDARVAERVAPLLDDESERVRAEAVQALAALGGTRWLPPDLADDPSFHVRSAFARALATDERPGSLETLRVLARDSSLSVRAAAIDALAARLGDAYGAAVDTLLADTAWPMRVAAAGAAGRLGPAVALPLLQRAVNDEDVRVRTAALEALPDDRGDGLISAALESDDLAIRGTAVALVARRKRPDRLDRLRRVYDASAGIDWIEVRESIVDAIAEIDGAPRLLSRIAAEDPAASVRTRARVALAARGSDVPVPGESPGAHGQAEHENSPFLDISFEDSPVVVLETSRGELEIQCLADDAPIHVANFVKLVSEGFYDGLPWHRVVSNFVIQGGDPRGDGWGGAGYTLRDEINARRFERGAVGMPKAGKDTGSCQVFITHIPTPHLDGNYTVFGRVTSGIEVLDRIEVGDRIVRARVK